MGATILIVDDSPTVRAMVRQALETEHHRVVEADDGATALEVAEREQPALVITDVNMPRIDGITLVRELRGRRHFRFVPILVLTTESSDVFKRRGRDAGATGWIVKPFLPAVLLKTVATVLPAHRP